MEKSLSTAWETSRELRVAPLRGQVGLIDSIEVRPGLVHHIDLSLSPIVQAPRERKAFDVSDLCPDPLVFAVNHGLPRLRILDEQIDGGSQFVTEQQVSSGKVTLVPRIAEILERYSRHGRRIIKTVYETRLYTEGGHLVGVARGMSIDIEKAGES